MSLKIVLFYNQADAGWTETFYTADSDPKVIRNSAWAAVFQASINVRCQPVYLFAARASVILPTGATYTLPLSNSYYVPNTNLSVPMPTTVSAYYTMQGGSGHSRRIAIRGVSEDDVNRNTDGEDIAQPDLIKHMKAYYGALCNAGCGILYTGKPNPPVTTSYEVTQIAAGPNPTANSVLTITGVFGPEIVVGGYIRFKGVPKDDVPGFPSSCVVTAITNVVNSTATIPYRLRAQTNVFPQKMQMLRYTQGFDPFDKDSLYFRSFGERKTGRPFGASRGRARAIITRQ